MPASIVAKAITIAIVTLTSLSSVAEPSAATSCPPYGFINHPNNNVNLARNPSFERCIGPQSAYGSFTPSAAADWVMHSNNYNAKVSSECVVTHAPGPNGARMLHFVAGGGEGGVIQFMSSPPPKVMFSAWVFVTKGFVQIQPHGGGGGPVAHSSKLGEWEQLRVCSDGSVPTDAYIILNQDPAGGEFYVDRVEVKALP
jgi:hypothetical protein